MRSGVVWPAGILLVTGSVPISKPSSATAYPSIAAASQGGRSIPEVTLAANVWPNASANGTSSTGSGAVNAKIPLRRSCWVIIAHAPHFGELTRQHQDNPQPGSRPPLVLGRPEPAAARFDTASQSCCLDRPFR